MSKIKVFQEIRIVTLWLSDTEIVITALVTGLVFIFTLLSTCTLYIGVKQNNVLISMPALGMACVAVACIQIIFATGCTFFSISNSLLNKWKTEARLYNNNDVSKIRMQRFVKSLQIVSLPAGNVGIVDKK